MMELKRVGVFSCGKMLGVMYALIGLAVGGLVALFSLAGAAAHGQQGAAVVMGLGVAAVIVLPLMYGIGGFVGGVISGLLYNFLAAIVGGIVMDFESRQEQH